MMLKVGEYTFFGTTVLDGGQGWVDASFILDLDIVDEGTGEEPEPSEPIEQEQAVPASAPPNATPAPSRETPKNDKKDPIGKSSPDPADNIEKYNLELYYEKNGDDQLRLRFVPKSTDDNLEVVERIFDATNNVKTPAQRDNIPVKYSDNYYFPVQFPDGTWDVGKSRPSTNPNLGPRTIVTYVHIDVPTYNSKFDKKTDTMKWFKNKDLTTDWGYLLHSGPAGTTYGCI